MKQQIFLGIDCGSEHLWCYALDEKEQELWNGQIENAHKGYDWLLDRVNDWHKEGAVIWVAGEGIGGYMSPLDKYLQEAGCFYVNISATELKAYREMMGYSLDKDDERDARHLAEVLKWQVEKCRVRPVSQSDEYYVTLKENARVHEQLTKTKVETQNLLNMKVRQYWPELVQSGQFFSRSDAMGLLALLSEYPTPRLIVQAGLAKIEKVLWKATGKPQPNLSERIFTQAKRVKKRVQLPWSRVKAVQNLAMSLQRLIINLRDLEKELNEQVDKHPLGQWMLQLDGLGVRSVACFLGEVGDFSRFDSEAKLARYAGAGGVKEQSGKFKDKHRDRRCYNHHLKRVIMLMAQTRYLHHEESRQYVQSRKRSKDEHWNLLKKLARFIIRRLWKKWEELVNNQGIIQPSTT